MVDDTTKAIYRAIWNTDYDTDLAANGRCGSHRLAEQIAGALAKDGLLAAPAARLPTGAASQIATAVHNALCGCMGSNTGITLRSRDWELVRDAVASLLESWQGTSPAAPADDEVTVRALVDAVKGTREFRAGVIFGVPNDAVDLFAEGLARAALAALREGQ